MRTEQTTTYVAFDGKRFDSATECRAYEKANAHRQLVGLTAEQVDAAIARTDTDLADAIEAAGDAIRKARLGSGELRRKRKGSGGEGEAAPAEDAGDAQAEAADDVREAA